MVYASSPEEISFGRTLAVNDSFVVQWNDANGNNAGEDTELGIYLLTDAVIGSTPPSGAYIVESLFATAPADELLLLGVDGSSRPRLWIRPTGS